MADTSRLGLWVRRFLLEHLIKERNLSRGTQQSYRDTLTLLIPFAARKIRTSVDAMKLTDISADLVRLFLLHLEESRGCAIFNTEPASGGYPFARSVRGPLQPRAHRLV
jgi:integrase/recombinase XerD